MTVLAQVAPPSVERNITFWRVVTPPPTPKLLKDMYMRPKWGEVGLLSTHIDSRSPAPPPRLAAHAPGIQVTPSSEVHRPTPWPPQPVARSPANHILSAALYTTIGSP